MRRRLARKLPGTDGYQAAHFVVRRDGHGSASANRRTYALRSAARLFQLRLLLSNNAQAMSWLRLGGTGSASVSGRNLRSAAQQHRQSQCCPQAENDDIPGAMVSSAVADRHVMLRRLRGTAAASGEDPVLTSRQMSLRGMDALHQGRWDDAESLFKSAIALHPADERSHRQYAEVLWRRGERDAAIREMEESLKLSGTILKYACNWVAMYLERGDLHQAWTQAEEALAGHRNLVSGWTLPGTS